MPKHKTVKATQKTQMIQRAILGALALFGVIVFFVTSASRLRHLGQNESAIVSSVPSKSPAPTPVAVVVPNDTMPSPMVKKLPFTKGESFIYTLKNGDSLAKIGKVFCNDPRAYLYLAELNKITDTLHPGDTVKVTCK